MTLRRYLAGAVSGLLLSISAPSSVIAMPLTFDLLFPVDDETVTVRVEFADAMQDSVQQPADVVSVFSSTGAVPAVFAPFVGSNLTADALGNLFFINGDGDLFGAEFFGISGNAGLFLEGPIGVSGRVEASVFDDIESLGMSGVVPLVTVSTDPGTFPLASVAHGAVPSPGPLALLGAGLFALCAARSRPVSLAPPVRALARHRLADAG